MKTFVNHALFAAAILNSSVHAQRGPGHDHDHDHDDDFFESHGEIHSVERYIENSDKVWLLMSNAEEGSIDYLHVFETEHNKEVHGCLTPDKEGIKTLVTGLNNPSYIHYDWNTSFLYVCDDTKIWLYQIDFNEDDFLNGEGTLLIDNIKCKGLESDKFGNLFYVDANDQAISRIHLSQMTSKLTDPKFDVTPKRLYSADDTVTATNLVDITIEREYLYWTNSAHRGRHGSVHKAFTEPFIHPSPFQTYEDYQVENAQSIATNSHYLYFTGYEFLDPGFDETVSQLFIQKKNGAGYFTRYSQHDTDLLKEPSAIITYKETLLLITNQGFISQLDLRQYPPSPDQFYPDLIAELPTGSMPIQGLAFMSEQPLNLKRDGAYIGLSSVLLAASTLIYLAF